MGKNWLVVVWPDGEDAIAYGPMEEKRSDALVDAVEAAKGWHLADPSSFAWSVELRDPDMIVEQMEKDER